MKKILTLFMLAFCLMLFACKEKEESIDKKYLDVSIEEVYEKKWKCSFAQLEVIDINDNKYKHTNDDETIEYIKVKCKIIEDFYDSLLNGRVIDLLIDISEYKSVEAIKEVLLNQDYIIVYFTLLFEDRYKVYDEATLEELALSKTYRTCLDSVVSIIPIKDNKVDLKAIGKVRKQNSAFPYQDYISDNMSLEDVKQNLRDLSLKIKNRLIEYLYYGFSNCYLTLFKIENILEGVYQEEDRKYLIANCRIVEDFFERKERRSKVELFIDLNNFKDSESAREFLLNQDYVLCYYMELQYEEKMYITCLENFLSIIPIKDNKVNLHAIEEVSVYTRDVTKYSNYSKYITDGMSLEKLYDSLRDFWIVIKEDGFMKMFDYAYKKEEGQSFAQLEVISVDENPYIDSNSKKHMLLTCKVVEDIFSNIKSDETINLLIELDEYRNLDSARNFFLSQDYIIVYFRLLQEDYKIYDTTTFKEYKHDKLYKIGFSLYSSSDLHIIPIKNKVVDFYSIKDIKYSPKSFWRTDVIKNKMSLSDAMNNIKKQYKYIR